MKVLLYLLVLQILGILFSLGIMQLGNIILGLVCLAANIAGLIWNIETNLPERLNG